jgi:hypothetical protein
MHLTILIETAPTVLYTSIHATHFRTTGLPVLEYYLDNTRPQTTIISYQFTFYSLILHLYFYLAHTSCFSFIFASDTFVLTSLTTAIAKF